MSEGTCGEAQPYQGVDGLWYSQDANGYQYLWTGSGWVDASSPEAAQVMADNLSGLLQQIDDLSTEPPVVPPAVGYGSSTEQVEAQLIATGDPIAIQMAEDSQRARIEQTAVWTGDSDMDGTPNDTDPVDDNPDIETPGGWDPDPSVDTNSPFLDY